MFMAAENVTFSPPFHKPAHKASVKRKRSHEWLYKAHSWLP